MQVGVVPKPSHLKLVDAEGGARVERQVLALSHHVTLTMQANWVGRPTMCLLSVIIICQMSNQDTKVKQCAGTERHQQILQL